MKFNFTADVGIPLVKKMCFDYRFPSKLSERGRTI
jgi:hypothetical protein